MAGSLLRSKSCKNERAAGDLSGGIAEDGIVCLVLDSGEKVLGNLAV